MACVAPLDVLDDEAQEVAVAMFDDTVGFWFDGVFAWPGGLAGWPVTVESGAGQGYPVSEAVSCFGEVVVPGQR